MGRILLVDDAPFARMVLRTILEENGYEICAEAASGREGFEKYKQLRPDLVFCDIRMNEMDGVDCLKAIVAEDPGAKVVICAAISDQSRITEIMEAGAEGHIHKPINAPDLLRMTELLIGGADGRMPFKKMMEEYAEEDGLEKKPLLDFFAAFRSITGFDLDDPQADRAYLRDAGERLLVGICALLVPKAAAEQIERLKQLFYRLLSEISEWEK